MGLTCAGGGPEEVTASRACWRMAGSPVSHTMSYSPKRPTATYARRARERGNTRKIRGDEQQANEGGGGDATAGGLAVAQFGPLARFRQREVIWVRRVDKNQNGRRSTG